MKGLFVSVYRATGYNCTNGPTSRCDTVLLIGEGVAEVFEDRGLPVLKLVRRVIAGQEYLYAEPFEYTGHHRMFGGNFIHTSDSRFPNSYPIPVHDREE